MRNMSYTLGNRCTGITDLPDGHPPSIDQKLCGVGEAGSERNGRVGSVQE
jgi:hypothetical protein